MKFYSGLAFSQLFVSIIASAADPRFGHIYLYDPSSPRPDQTADRLVDPKTARLIFARRLGLSRYHTINDASAVEIRQINTFGGDHSSLFGEDTKESRPRSLILVEGVNEAKDLSFPTAHQAELQSLLLSHPPSFHLNRRLLEDFAKQAKHVHHTAVQPSWTPFAHSPSISLAFDGGRSLDQLSSVTIQDVSLLRIVSLIDSDTGLPIPNKRYREAANELNHSLNAVIAQAKEHGVSLTIVLMPPSLNKSKRMEKGYGDYDTPSDIARRQDLATERPLASNPQHIDPSNLSSSLSEPESINDASMKGPLRGILPACFSSLDTCRSATRNCTGHGHCTIKYNTTELDGRICYSCACKADVIENEDGTKKTVRFGGPACQKRDISTPFWLLTGFSVAMLFLVSWGIGLLYSVGQEDLPSVIGAGVAGPRAK